MDYFPAWDPMDSQAERGGKLVPALPFIQQFERLDQKAAQGDLTTAEYALLSRFDHGKLHQFEQSRELSIELLIEWLSGYKYEDWQRAESRDEMVTGGMRREKARGIVDCLGGMVRRHSHSRAIDMPTLQSEIGLKTHDLADLPANIIQRVPNYFDLPVGHMQQRRLSMFAHTRGYF